MTLFSVPAPLGGSGITYSDDGTGVRDLRNGGHRPWLLPMLTEVTAASSAAVAAAQQATSLAGTAITGSSSTSLTISTGTKVLTIETGKAFVPGMAVRIGDATAANTNFMDGTVTTYNAGTGTLTVSITAIGGSGTLSSWSVRPPTANVNGDAGPTITTATTLTASSERVRPVAMTTDAQSVTLPNATTLSEGGPLFVFPNTGARTFGVRDSAGTLLRAVQPGGVAELYLRDNATAAGSWTVSGQGLSPVMTICDNTLPSTLTQGSIVAARLTDTLSVHFGRNVSDHPFVFAADSTPGSAAVGTPALIVASALDIEHAFRISATKAMVKIAGTTGNVYNVTVDPVTRACTVGGSPASAAVFDAATFTGAPLIAQLGANNDLFVAIDTTGTTVRAQAVDCSGINPSAGSSINLSALGTGSVVALGVFRESDTRAAAFWIDDSGTAGTPFSIRCGVITATGTSLALGTVQGVNDVVSAVTLPICQHAPGLYTIGYYQASGTLVRAVGVTIATTTVTFGAPATVETVSVGDQTFTNFNANRFQPNMFAMSATTALFTYGNTSGSVPVRHVVLTNSAGAVTAGAPLFGAWTDATGGNFPPAPDGFLAIDGNSAMNQVYAVSFNGTTPSVTGTFGRFDIRVTGNALSATQGARFGLSGGIRGIFGEYTGGGPAAIVHIFRFAAGGPPVYLGAANLNATTAVGFMVELSPNKAGIVQGPQAKDTTGNRQKLTILEFAAA